MAAGVEAPALLDGLASKTVPPADSLPTKKTPRSGQIGKHQGRRYSAI